jgi:ribose transport system ATP-binding protein
VTQGREHALRVEGLSKTFPGIRALRDAALTVRRGEIHALVGGNGSGKTTLLKILAGVSTADRGGTVSVYGRSVPADRVTPAWARAAGLRFVHQELGVFPGLTVAENLAVGAGFEKARAGAIDRRRTNERARVSLGRFEIDADPGDPVDVLLPPDRTMLAIARALQGDGDGPRVYVLDEPTASLPAPRADLVYRALREQRDAGNAVLFVSHRLDEVAAAADRATVLRDGAVVGTRSHDELDRDDLIELIVGRPIALEARPTVVDPQVPIRLEVRDLAGRRVDGVSFAVRRGEVLGLAGSVGSGRSEVLQILFGARRRERGSVVLDGAPIRFAHVGDAMRAGVAYVPAQRADAAFAGLSLSENITAATVSSYWDRLWLHRRREREDARSAMERFSIRARSPGQEMATLSGGNQQKAIVARWLRRLPTVLLLDDPTRGVDAAARVTLHGLITDAVRAGACAIVASDDFEELATLADRVLVLQRGRVVRELSQPDIDAARLADAAFRAPVSSR